MYIVHWCTCSNFEAKVRVSYEHEHSTSRRQGCRSPVLVEARLERRPDCHRALREHLFVRVPVGLVLRVVARIEVREPKHVRVWLLQQSQLLELAARLSMRNGTQNALVSNVRKKITEA